MQKSISSISSYLKICKSDLLNWDTPLSFSVSALLVMLFNVLQKSTITNFKNRAIGHAIVNSIDPTKRLPVFVFSIIIFFFSFFLCKLFFSSLDKSAHKNAILIKVRTALLFDLALFLSVNIIVFCYTLFKGNYNKFNIVFLLSSIIVVIALDILIDLIFHYSKDEETGNQYFFRLSVPFFVACSIIPFAVSKLSFLTFFFCYVVLFFILKFTFKRFRSNIHIFAIPLSLIPISLPIGNEIQYTLLVRTGNIYETKVVIFFTFLFFLLVFALFYYLCRNKMSFSIDKIINNWYFPVILVSLAVFLMYKDYYVASGSYDMLHTGNKIVPLQQLFQFGKIPFVDYWGGQSNELGALFYILFNGINQLEPILWVETFYYSVVILLTYFLLKKFIEPKWLFFSFIFLPFIAFTNLYYVVALLPLLYLKKLLAKKRVIDYFIFFMLSLVAFAYMATVGKIAILSVLIITAVFFFEKGEKKKIVLGFLLSFGLIGSLYFLITYLSGHSIQDQLTLILAFSDMDTSIGSYAQIISEKSLPIEITLVYVVFPVLAAVLFLYHCLKKDKEYSDFFMMFISLASLISSFRGLQRHSLTEGFFMDFYFLILLLIPFFYDISKKTNVKKLIFSSIFALLLILFPQFDHYSLGSGLIRVDKNPNSQVSLTVPFYTQIFTEPSRYIPNNEILPLSLIDFFDNNLRPDQTFFQIINAHLLYTMAEKEAPFFHHAEQVIFSESPQEVYVKLLNERKINDEIPIILFDGPSLRNIDGIKLELSLFKLVEYIYQNYRPYTSIDGYQLWIADNSDISKNNISFPLLNDEDVLQEIAFFDLPYIWANYDEKVSESYPEILLEIFNIVKNEMETIAYLDSSSIDKTSGNYLALTVSSDRAQEISIRLGEKGVASLNLKEGTHHYLVRVSIFYEWYSDNIESFSITHAEGTSIEGMSILKGD